MNEEKLFDNHERFLRECVDYIGTGFHPDTPFSDYIKPQTNDTLFSPEAAADWQVKLDAAIDAMGVSGVETFIESAFQHLLNG